MAVVRIPINPLQKGRVGAYSWYVRKGEQVVRQRKNSSNYGEEASRSLSQQQRRVLWSNLVNFYKANKNWMPKCFENMKTTQTVYNRFMQLNIDKFGVAWTKEQAQQGWTVVDGFRVSDGSLYPIKFANDPDGGYTIRLAVGSQVTALSTVGVFSQAIVDGNQGFAYGDNLAFVFFEQLNDVGMYPMIVPHYLEITLNAEDETVLNTLPLFYDDMTYFEEGKWHLYSGDSAAISFYGFVAIHTRKDGGLKVSTQDIIMDNTELVERFSTAQQVQAAIESYGLTVEVPLAPSFKVATIEQVTLNGSAVSNPFGRTIQVTGPQTLVIRGTGLSPETVKLMHGDTLYTPLLSDSVSLTYILGDNGTNRITLNGQFSFGVEVSGIVVPSWLPQTFSAGRVTSFELGGSWGVKIPSVTTNCVNIPLKATEAEPAFKLQFANGDESGIDYSKISGVNCEVLSGTSAGGSGLIVGQPTDVSEVAYMTYQGFIFCVFNY